MPTQTRIAVQPIVGPYPSLPVGAGSLDLVFTPVDAINGNYFVANPVTTVGLPDGLGGNILLVSNPAGGSPPTPLTITFMSQPLNGRSGDIVSYSVGLGMTSAFKYSQLVGWADANGFVYFLA